MPVQWPLPDRFKPQISGWQMRMPGLTRRAQFDDGPDRVRRTAHQRPVRQRFDLDILRTDMPVLRRWYLEDLDGGRLWFELSAFVDDAYQTVEARLVDDGEGPWTARLAGDFEYRLSMEIEIRALPRLDDARYYARQGVR